MKQKDILLLEMFYNEGLESQKKVIKFGDFGTDQLGYFGKLRAKRAIDYFLKILPFEPEDFRLYLFIGKNYQSLRQFDKALYYLEKSCELNRKDSFIPLEASIVSMHLNKIDKALNFITEAIKRDPEDAELIAVHAMYLIIEGKLKLSQEVVNRALRIDPRNNFIIELKVIIDKVNLGHLTRPTMTSLFYP